MMTSDISFIDTNIFLYALAYKKENILTWIDGVYSNIYVHADVLKEMKISSQRQQIESFIIEHNWHIFDPNNLDKKTHAQYVYLHHQVSINMQELTNNRLIAGLTPKYTANTGEISILAACRLINGNIVCSNDGDVRDLLEQEHYSVIDPTNNEDVLIVQEDLMDLCVKTYALGISSRKSVRKFFGAIIGKQSSRESLFETLNERLNNI